MSIPGGTRYKRPKGDMPQAWVAKSVSWYISEPLMQNLIYEWVDTSQFSQIWAKIGSNLRKF